MSTPAIIAKQLDEARPWFESWQAASEFSRRAQGLAGIVDSNFYFNRNKAKWLREAWILAQYAELAKPSMLRLCRGDPPDAYAQMEEAIFPIEMTEVIDAEWHRGREHRLPPGESAVAAHHREPHSPTEIAKALANRILEKAQSDYDEGTVLLVNLDISDHSSMREVTEAEIRSVLSVTHHPFSAVRAIWMRSIY